MDHSRFLSVVHGLHDDARQRGLYFQHHDGSADGRTITMGGRSLLWFGSCSYLGLEHEPALVDRAVDAVRRPYDAPRLAEVRRRQDFVLDRLAALGTAIETCPASNLRIGGVPRPEDHPAHRFVDSPVDLAVSADDPGIFDAPLAAEVEWLLAHGRLDATGLADRLGDPRRLALGRLRPTAGG